MGKIADVIAETLISTDDLEEVERKILELVEGCRPKNKRLADEKPIIWDKGFVVGYNKALDEYEQNLNKLKEE